MPNPHSKDVSFQSKLHPFFPLQVEGEQRVRRCSVLGVLQSGLRNLRRTTSHSASRYIKIAWWISQLEMFITCWAQSSSSTHTVYIYTYTVLNHSPTSVGTIRLLRIKMSSTRNRLWTVISYESFYYLVFFFFFTAGRRAYIWVIWNSFRLVASDNNMLRDGRQHSGKRAPRYCWNRI